MSAPYLARAARLVPPLAHSLRKGDAGRIAVLGGSLEYTGAPFLAAMSAFRTGCDLVHVVASPAAAPAIKAFSPDIIVHPLLDGERADQVLPAITTLLGRMHAVLLGPGLGRAEPTLRLVQRVALFLREQRIPLVVDADGLYALCQQPDAFRNHPFLVLTPNHVELRHLYSAVHVELTSGESALSAAQFCSALSPTRPEGVVVVAKGQSDRIFSTQEQIVVVEEGSPRRVGGQGDLLSGAIATFVAWATQAGGSDVAAAAAAACDITRRACNAAFREHGRGMLASDALPHVARAFRAALPQCT